MIGISGIRELPSKTLETGFKILEGVIRVKQIIAVSVDYEYPSDEFWGNLHEDAENGNSLAKLITDSDHEDYWEFPLETAKKLLEYVESVPGWNEYESPLLFNDITEYQIKTEKTQQGWVMEISTNLSRSEMYKQYGVIGEKVLYTKETLEKLGIDYNADPGKRQSIRLVRTIEETLVEEIVPDKVLKKGIPIDYHLDSPSR